VLIVISDLHLMDGTAGAHHLDPGGVRSVMLDLAAHAREAQATEITLLFLGDVFDLYRTERWFEYPLELRPWGATPSDEALFDVYEGVVSNNLETFAMLQGSLVDQLGFPVEPARMYVPGNHDSVVNEHPQLRRRTRSLLGMPDGDELFPRHVLDPEHGVFARHGQEFDRLNFEGSEALDAGELVIPEEAYRVMPIGDAMACEYASKIAPLVSSLLPPDHPNRARIAERMRDIVDVRPLAGMVRWALWQATQVDKTTEKTVVRAMREAANDMHDLAFTKEWIAKHDRFGWDEADQFQAFLGILRTFGPGNYRRALTIGDKLAALSQADRYARAAVDDFGRLDATPEGKDIYYVLYGHTHGARQIPVQVLGEPPNERYRVYFNTGTWRPTHRMLLGDDGFASWKEITYLLVYRPGELVSGGTVMTYPAVESWTGTVVVGRGRRTTAYQPIPKILQERVGMPSTPPPLS
jgi:UDP-2,3-diacylglucosamine pyrophosphatase LpxH